MPSSHRFHPTSGSPRVHFGLRGHHICALRILPTSAIRLISTQPRPFCTRASASPHFQTPGRTTHDFLPTIQLEHRASTNPGQIPGSDFSPFPSPCPPSPCIPPLAKVRPTNPQNPPTTHLSQTEPLELNVSKISMRSHCGTLSPPDRKKRLFCDRFSDLAHAKNPWN